MGLLYIFNVDIGSSYSELDDPATKFPTNRKDHIDKTQPRPDLPRVLSPTTNGDHLSVRTNNIF